MLINAQSQQNPSIDFNILPETVANLMGADLRAFKVIVDMTVWCLERGYKEIAWSHKTLANLAKMSRRHFIRIQKKLISLKLIMVESGKTDRLPNLYMLNDLFFDQEFLEKLSSFCGDLATVLKQNVTLLEGRYIRYLQYVHKVAIENKKLQSFLASLKKGVISVGNIAYNLVKKACKREDEGPTSKQEQVWWAPGQRPNPSHMYQKRASKKGIKYGNVHSGEGERPSRHVSYNVSASHGSPMAQNKTIYKHQSDPESNFRYDETRKASIVDKPKEFHQRSSFARQPTNHSMYITLPEEEVQARRAALINHPEFDAQMETMTKLVGKESAELYFNRLLVNAKYTKT